MLIKKNKKGLSEIIAYVLLIVIAISLSLLVYSWLKGYIIGKPPSCPDELSIVLENYSCHNKTISLDLRNNGLFTIYGIVVRESNITGRKAVYTIGYPFNDITENLTAGKTKTITFDYKKYNVVKGIEIEPYILEKEITICPNAIIKQEITGCE